MSRVLVVCRRELKSALNSAPAYIFAAFFLSVSAGWLFLVRGFFVRGEASLRPYFEIMPAVLSVLTPALTMRSWAEEKRSGTYELLATLPFRPGEMVAGKYLAVLAVVAGTLVLSLAVPLSLSRFGDFDAGVLASEYLGVLSMASACAAIGQLVSSRSRNQVSAFLATAAVLLVLSLAGRAAAVVGAPRAVADAAGWISIGSHFEAFSRGILDSGDLSYFVLATAVSLYLTAKSLVREALG